MPSASLLLSLAGTPPPFKPLPHGQGLGPPRQRPSEHGSVREGRWPRAGRKPSFTPLAGRRTRHDATGAGSFWRPSHRDLPGGHTSPKRILQEFLLSRWAEEQHLKTCVKGRGSIEDDRACTDFLCLQPVEQVWASPAWAPAPAPLPTRKDPLRCKHSNPAHLEMPPTATPAAPPMPRRAGAGCPAPFALGAQMWPQRPPPLWPVLGVGCCSGGGSAEGRSLFLQTGMCLGLAGALAPTSIPLGSEIASIQLPKPCLTTA